MASDLLNDKAIRAALKRATDTGKLQRVTDGNGLYLEARPNGAGWWRFRYRRAGSENMLSLGTYPDIPLTLARKRRNEARQQVAAGTDPSAQRKTAKAEDKRSKLAAAMEAAGLAGPGSFEFVAREWLTTVHEAKVSPGHAERTRIRFEQDAFPWLGRRPLRAIEPPELLELLRRVTERGAIETAHRLKDACGQVFRYGIAAGLCERNPAADLRDALPPVPTRHHAAVTEPEKAAELLRAMADYHGHPVTRAALALSALLFLRPGEVRQMEWAWVDLDAALVKIPGSLMKRKKAEKENGAPHLVPLAPQAVVILRELHALTGHGRYVFPALQTALRPMSENTINTAIRRMGYGNDEMTAHGFRAMARTLAAERLGVAGEVIEAQLAHAVAGPLGRSYDRTQFVEQRRELMTKWADYLDRLREGAQVIPLQGRAA